MKRTSIQWNYRHVKGYQDNHKEEEALDKWERANVEADKSAKEYWDQMQDEEPPIWPHAFNGEEG